MTDMNIPANDAPTEQAPAIAPSTKTDDQILPLSKWVPIGKSNCILDFWDTMCYNSSTGLYSYQLDEQWFNLYKDILKDALVITLTNNDNPFVAPPLSDTVIEYVNTLGYPNTLRNVSAMSVNALYQPWRAILSMINMCLTGKTARYDRPRHPVLQILWGIIHRSNIDYAKRIWEEFVQSIQTFLTNRKNLATASRGKKKTAFLLIPNVRFTKLIIYHLRTKYNIHPRTGSPLHYSHDENVLNTLRFVGKDGRETFGMPIPDALLTDEIKGAPYYNEYQEHIDEPSDEGVPVKEPAHDDDIIRSSTGPRAKSKGARGTNSGTSSSGEQVAHDLLTLQNPKKKSLAEQFIFQRRTPMPTEPTGHADSPFVDVELALSDSETESDEEVPMIKTRDQDEGQVGPNPGEQYEGQAGPNPDTLDEESQPQPSHVVHAGPNLEHMDLESTDASTQQNPEQIDE
ncbi:hypothetical protein Tco_0576591 [Tanacetum coccineum]